MVRTLQKDKPGDVRHRQNLRHCVCIMYSSWCFSKSTRREQIKLDICLNKSWMIDLWEPDLWKSRAASEDAVQKWLGTTLVPASRDGGPSPEQWVWLGRGEWPCGVFRVERCAGQCEQLDVEAESQARGRFHMWTHWWWHDHVGEIWGISKGKSAVVKKNFDN